MADSNRGGSPLEAVGGVSDSQAADAFELLANEMRLAILLALWEAYEPFASTGGLSFTELRERVGRPDSGQFNYHIGKLNGQFITSTDEGYKLRPAGEKVIRAVIAGSGLETPTLESTDIGMPCPRCEGPTVITYRSGRLLQLCTECSGNFDETEELPPGTLYVWRLEPAGLANRTPEEVYAAASIGMLQRARALTDGVCPECSGAVAVDLELCDSHDPDADSVCPDCGRQDEALVVYQCSVCKFSGGAAPSDVVSQHPAVVAFYYGHGVDLQYALTAEEVRTVLDLVEAHDQTIESTDPVRIRVTVRYGGDELTLLLDETMAVLEVDG